ncbi:hypothetical protein BKG76_09680 [Mycobacteroides franklinii]|uniref:Helix-turn-helix domain-containing protein n=1 Tax=Mycobacteroides franklinii TaxID=948102 RepID=A0A1S1L5F5_9MYCO|nr:hypothetical protein BKG76_09680 [Mycobacteroides franklinii]
MADVLKPYLNIRITPLDSIDTSSGDDPSLLDQARGKSPLMLSVDKPRPVPSRGLTEADQAEVVEMYARGMSLAAIARERRMSRGSVAKLLDRAGVERRKVGRRRKRV